MARTDLPIRSTTGCLLAYVSALMTALMLLVNGSLVMAVLGSLSRNGLGYFSNPKLQQFLLFTCPVLMAVGQWLMIDYVRTRTSRKS